MSGFKGQPSADAAEAIVRSMDERPEDERAFRSDADNEGDDSHTDPDSPRADARSSGEEALAAARQWRVAKALLTLRAQVNAIAPRRNKASDGTIGDNRHCGRPNSTSDHCARIVHDGVGVVAAMDITHDPANGCDAAALAESIRQSRDPRVKYLISRRRIANSSPIGGSPAWEWRRYSGSNPHDKHCHISVKSTAGHYDDTGQWTIQLSS
jgi:hypothetical protein